MKKVFVLFLIILSAMCGLTAENPWKPGLGSFTYTGYEPLKERPITVYYYVPVKHDIKKMPVLFVMHGADRDGLVNVETWRYFAEEDGFIVIGPQYSKEYYTENDYQFGSVYENAEFLNMNPPQKWTYNTIEALFDYFKRETGNISHDYDIWGHSAGGQFVHRFMLVMPDARVRTGVASNPGSWTFPLVDGVVDKNGVAHGWPYSVKNTPFAQEEHLVRFFSRDMVVHLGNADIATSGSGVPTGDAALAQGRCRFDRGRNFFKTSRKVAKKMSAEFNWKQVEVDDVGHAGRSIVYGKSRTVNGKREFSIDYITTSGAYYVLYGKTKVK